METSYRHLARAMLTYGRVLMWFQRERDTVDLCIQLIVQPPYNDTHLLYIICRIAMHRASLLNT